MDDFLELSIGESVADSRESAAGALFGKQRIPLLCIHGSADRGVPLAEGRALFDRAAEPKAWLEIAKGNHLLTNSKDLKKALSRISEFIKEWGAS